MCTEDDINWLNDFYDRIFDQVDPMALLTKIRKEKLQKKNSVSKSQQNNTYIERRDQVTAKGSLIILYKFLVFICCILLIMLIINFLKL